jgi:hypothetical protein
VAGLGQLLEQRALGQTVVVEAGIVGAVAVRGSRSQGCTIGVRRLRRVSKRE